MAASNYTWDVVNPAELKIGISEYKMNVQTETSDPNRI
jgi:hypothetical protein